MFPVGAGLWTRLHPEDRIDRSLPALDASMRRRRGCPSSPRPGSGARAIGSCSTSTSAEGVRACSMRSAASRRAVALHGQGPARLRVQHDDDRAVRRPFGAAALQPGKHRIIDRHHDRQARGGPADVTSPSMASQVMRVDVKRPCPALSRPARRSTSGLISARPFRSPISIGAPFAFTGRIAKVTVDLK